MTSGSNMSVSTKAGQPENIGRTKIDLDTILVEEIGQFGRFQLGVLLLAALVVIFGSWGSSGYVFTAARIDSRCHIPECDSAEPEFSPEWLVHAVPGSAGAPDNCQRYANSSSDEPEPGLCPAALFDQNVVVPCEVYVYDNTNTVVYDFNLACNEWRRSLIGSARTLGTLTTLPVTGYVSDRWGRRAALVLNAMNMAWIGVMRYFVGAYSYIGFMMLEFLESTFGSGGFSTAFILMMEVMGPKYRVAAGATMNACFSVGQILLALIAWAVPSWRMLTLTLYIPQFVTITYLWLMSDSVRWYLSKGRYNESEALLQKMAKTNGKQLSPTFLKALRHTIDEEKIQKIIEESDKANEPWLIVKVFRHKKILLRCCVSPVWWITNTFIYYGMSINSVNMSGNKYLNFAVVSAAEIPGYYTAVYLVDKIGRKPVLAGAFWTCAACQAAYIFMPTGIRAASLTVYLIGKYSSAMVMTSVYVYTAELYPTAHRHSLFAFSSMVGRIGSVLAPLTPAFGAATFAEMPFVLFGSFALLSGALVLLTPETLGTKLPDTMRDAEDIGTKEEVA